MDSISRSSTSSNNITAPRSSTTFYKRALQQLEDARAGGKIMKMREEDIPEVAEENFRYSGPKPQTRESAIISLADMVESASRSLEKPTPQRSSNW